MHHFYVNGNSFNIKGMRHTGSEILANSGFEPVDEHILIEAAKVGSRLISLDEIIDLKDDVVERFYVFRSGEVYTFTLNGHGYQWGKNEISEVEIREFARVPEEDVVLFEKEDAEPQILFASDTLTLGSPGTEHLKTEKRLVSVFYDNDPKQIPRGTYTTQELMNLFEVPAGYLLNLADEHGLHTLKPDQRTHVKDGMKFFSQVPGGGSS